MTAPRPARPQDLEPACALLSDAGLPLAGVDVHFAAFRVLDAPDGTIAGLVGAERYDGAWLLRSLVVHPARRGRGHGSALVSSILAEARRAGANDIFLLTTDAQPFFAAHGFAEVPRDSAPAPMWGSAELRGACPDSATLMALEDPR
jgi:N-acetylglutamate synthase-like GNAT family acetyltransferase